MVAVVGDPPPGRAAWRWWPRPCPGAARNVVEQELRVGVGDRAAGIVGETVAGLADAQGVDDAGNPLRVMA